MPFLNRINKDTAFLAGTSNYILKTIPSLAHDIFLDLDKNIIEFKDENLKNILAPRGPDKEFIRNILGVSMLPSNIISSMCIRIIETSKKTGPKKELNWLEVQQIEDEEVQTYRGGEDWMR